MEYSTEMGQRVSSRHNGNKLAGMYLWRQWSGAQYIQGYSVWTFRCIWYGLYGTRYFAYPLRSGSTPFRVAVSVNLLHAHALNVYSIYAKRYRKRSWSWALASRRRSDCYSCIQHWIWFLPNAMDVHYNFEGAGKRQKDSTTYEC